MRFLPLFICFISLHLSALELDLSDLVEPKKETSDYYQCDIDSTVKSTVLSDAKDKCSQVYVNNNSQGISYTVSTDSGTYRRILIVLSETYCIYDNLGNCLEEKNKTVSTDVRVVQIRGQEYTSCPPDEHPDHIHMHLDDVGTEWCAKEYVPTPPNCPEPTENDYQQFGQGQQETFCYTNPDGTQCRITTDENGDFTLPYQYGTQEPSICHNEPVDTPDPDPMPDVPETPDAEDPTPHDNSEGDDSDKTTDIDALNQINDNLTIINDSINTASDANSERLNLIKDNIDNSNLYLDSIEENTGKSLGALQQQTALLAEIRDKEDKDKAITASANRKTGGLNDFFTDEDKAKLVIELENKKQQLTDVYTQIQNDVTDRFNFSNSISGTYESRTITWNGHQKEIGAARLSENFFKQLAPIVLLVCSIIALGILLWE